MCIAEPRNEEGVLGDLASLMFLFARSLTHAFHALEASKSTPQILVASLFQAVDRSPAATRRPLGHFDGSTFNFMRVESLARTTSVHFCSIEAFLSFEMVSNSSSPIDPAQPLGV